MSEKHHHHAKHSTPGALGPRLALVALIAAAALLLTPAPALAAPEIRHSSAEPYVEVEEFPPGASTASADFYAIVGGSTTLPTTVSFQYVDAAAYQPAEPEPYAAGTTVTFATELTNESELHLHLSLATETTYHWRLLASNSQGVSQVEELTDTHAPAENALPDARAYEQVSPADKNHVDAVGYAPYSNALASLSGSAFAYFSFLPFPQATASGGFFTPYLTTRSPSPAAWSTQSVNNLIGFTEDLTEAIVEAEVPLPAPPGQRGVFLRDSATGQFQLLAVKYETSPGYHGKPVHFAGASQDDSRILLQAGAQLLPDPAPGLENLYVWDESRPEAQRLSLAGLVPPAGQPSCGPAGPLCLAPPNGATAAPGGRESYSQALGALSADDSRVFFAAEGHIYERLPAAEETVAVAPGAATFLAATPDGRYVFYSEGPGLYRFDTATETTAALTAGAEAVLGSLGVAADGSTVYFVAPGLLAANHNANGEEALKGADNLYRWHEGATTFVARLLPGDAANWIAGPYLGGGERNLRTSRLDPAGTALLFSSTAPLTGYANIGPYCGPDGRTSGPCPEFYLYAAAGGGQGSLACVTCNPSGAPPSQYPVSLGQGDRQLILTGPALEPHLTRNLSADGARVFFETEEALLPADRNNTMDVYEWERPGAGSCSESSSSYFPANAGCLYLISTGTAHARSYFGDASASGDDVFFFTRQPLVRQDRDLNFDVYDARVDGGIASQNPPAAEPACEAEPACRPPVGQPPSHPTGASELFHGPPNPTYCRKGFLLKRDHCVKKRAKRHKHSKHHTATHHRGGGR